MTLNDLERPTVTHHLSLCNFFWGSLWRSELLLAAKW